MRLRAILIAAALTTSGVALAQDAPPPADPPADGAKTPAEGDKKPVEEEHDPTLFEGENPGEDENPNAPKIDLVGDPPKIEKKAPPRPPGYPQEVVLRPITLPGGMAQAIFDYRVAADAFQGDGILGAHYGITPQIQAGFRYGVGSVHEGGFEPGKAFALDFEYLVRDWIAAQLSVPILADPFTVAVTLGAPMKFTFRDQFRFEMGRDLVTFRTNRDFVPRVGDSLGTAGAVELDMTNTQQSNGEIRLVPSLIYQKDVKMSFEGRFGLVLDDFELNSDSPLPLELGATYAHSQMLDFGGRIGFNNLSTIGDGKGSFGVSIFTRFRI